ncbi:MAG: hypothetical protein RL095_2892 [Verrucomicrobiota bacterium]|jgi:CheY-like chemotaxis protein
MSPLTRGTVLVIEDDPLLALSYGDLLESAGWRHERAGNLREALSRLASGSFSLVICDHDLPDGKGLTILDRLAAQAEPPPLIYLSAATPEVLAACARHPRVLQVMPKPVNESILRELLGQHGRSGATGSRSCIGAEERRILLASFEDPAAGD